MKGNLDENAKIVQMLDPASYAAAAEAFTAGVDCAGYDELLIMLSMGTATATGDVTFQVEESDSLSTGYVDVTGALLGVGTTPAEVTVSNDNTVYLLRLDLGKRKRFIRVGYDVDDDNVIFGILGVLSRPQVAPVTQVNAVVASV